MICHWEDSDVVVQEVLVNVRRLIIQPRMLPDETYHNLGLSYLHLYRIRRADCMTCLLSPSATRDTPLSYSIAQYNPRDTRLSHILIPISIRIYSLFRRSVGPDPILSGLALPEGMAALALLIFHRRFSSEMVHSEIAAFPRLREFVLRGFLPPGCTIIQLGPRASSYIQSNFVLCHTRTRYKQQHGALYLSWPNRRTAVHVALCYKYLIQ